jgi:hypothetical protein
VPVRLSRSAAQSQIGERRRQRSLGLLQELNRERRDFVGITLAGSMFLYALVQLTATWKQELVFPGYVLAAFLKIALLLTMVSFGVLVRHAAIVRREAQNELIDLIILLRSNLKHEISDQLKTIDAEVAKLSTVIAEKEVETLVASSAKSLEVARSFFDDWPNQLRPMRVDMVQLLSERQITVIGLDETLSYEVIAPPLFITWALARLCQNAIQAGATAVSAILERGADAQQNPIVLVRLANNGPPVPSRGLFKRPHGTWIARHLLDLLDGKLELDRINGDMAEGFKLELPLADLRRVKDHDASLGR